MTNQTECPICKKWHNCYLDHNGRIHLTCPETHVMIRYSKAATDNLAIWGKIRKVMEPQNPTLEPR